MSSVQRTIFKAVLPYLQRFDVKTTKHVDLFIANSHFVKKRIKRVYNRDSIVIYPHVNLDSFRPDQVSQDYYLIVSRLVPYKRIDLAVQAFNKLGKKLIIIGEGSERPKLISMANENVQIMGYQSSGAVKRYFEHCKAFLFPGVEDFGITPLEAQAAGKPVIAYRDGGALETIKEGETGLFFDEQTVDSLMYSVHDFEKHLSLFDAGVCRKQAEKFGPKRFHSEFKQRLTEHYPSYFSTFDWGV